MGNPKYLLGIVLMAVPATLVWWLSVHPAYTFYQKGQSALAVSFRFNPQKLRPCGEEELARVRKARQDRPEHMQRAGLVCGSRERRHVRLRLVVDGRVVIDRTLDPSGIRDDGAVYYYRSLTFPAGTYRLALTLAEEGAESDGRRYRLEREVVLRDGHKHVIRFLKGEDALRFSG